MLFWLAVIILLSIFYYFPPEKKMYILVWGILGYTIRAIQRSLQNICWTEPLRLPWYRSCKDVLERVLLCYLGGLWNCLAQGNRKGLYDCELCHLFIISMPCLVGESFQKSDMWLGFRGGKWCPLNKCCFALFSNSQCWNQPFWTIFHFLGKIVEVSQEHQRVLDEMDYLAPFQLDFRHVYIRLR